MMRAALTIVFALLAGPALAQTATCYDQPGYLVVAAPNGEVGDDFAVYAKSAPEEALPCAFDAESADLLVKGWYDFEGIADKYLALSEGSSPIRSLMIFDMSTGALLVSADAWLQSLTPERAQFWERRELATKSTCPQFKEFTGYGGSAVISYHVEFDLASGAARDTGLSRCDYMQ